MHLVPVVLAGGIGERFWPLSRSYQPKQLLPLISNRSMMEETIARVQGLSPAHIKPLIVTGQSMIPLIKKALPKNQPYDCIGEPSGKNTAPAIAIAAAYIQKKYGDSLMVILPADHAISPLPKYHAALKSAAILAEKQDKLVVFGIKPNRPDTGYGYIHLGSSLGRIKGIATNNVRGFVEKPDAKTAAGYVKSGDYFWNSGMFVWKTSTILSEFEQHMPALFALTTQAVRAKLTPAAITAFYKKCESQSIDYGIMEKSKRVAAIAGGFSWDDVGSWESMPRLFGKNKLGTTVIGDSIAELDCKNSIIVNKSNRAVAALGLNDSILVVTNDTVMAISRSALPDIKKYRARIKDSGTLPNQLF